MRIQELALPNNYSKEMFNFLRQVFKKNHLICWAWTWGWTEKYGILGPFRIIVAAALIIAQNEALSA